jgi:anti-anti-sigma factor
MPIDWSDDIVLVDFSDEPELSEEMSALFERLKLSAMLPPPAATGPSVDVSYKRMPVDAAMPAGATPNIVLNFTSVSYLNSSHLAALLRLRKRVVEGGRQLVLCGLNDELTTVMRHTGLDRIFLFAPDTMTALAHVQIQHERRTAARPDEPTM